MAKQSTIVFKVNDDLKAKIINYYHDKVRSKTPPYAIFQAEEADTVITLYESGKVMFQGPNADIDANMWQEFNDIIDHKINNREKYYHTSAIGSDEVGTGDYFGPVVVTATFVEKNQIPILEKMGINDSKQINDDFILKTVPQLIKLIKYESIILNNSNYNQNYNQDYNMNKIKAILHDQVLKKLTTSINNYDYVIVDEFCSQKNYFKYLADTNYFKNITFLTKAESIHLSVAAASMISRYLFLKAMDKMSDELHIPLPKGAGPHVDEIGLEIARKYGIEKLKDIAKINFKNTDRILEKLDV